MLLTINLGSEVFNSGQKISHQKCHVEMTLKGEIFLNL